MARLTYTGEHLREIAFPLGGIGTGTVSLGGRGQLCDFEIANRPAKGQAPFRNFFALGVDDGSGIPIARVLERQFFPPFTGSRGVPVHQVPGLPRFGEVRFTGEYPLAHLDFEDGATEHPFPVRVSLDAFNPMIPGNTEDSGLPAAILSWNLENRTERQIKALLVAVVSNLVGYQFSPWPGDAPWPGGQQVNRTLREQGFQGVLMQSERDGGRHPMAGSMAAVTTWPETTLQTRLGEQDWPYSLRPFWYQLLGSVPFEREEDATVAAPSGNLTVARRLEAALGMSITLDPGQSVTVPVILTWCFPNRYVQLPEVDEPRWVGNEYTQRFPSADSVASYVVAERERLEAGTRDFHRHLYATTVPDFAIDAVSGNMATIRTQTCFRDASGQFYAYEGCNPDSGCCPMNCTHVWMYEQALASLYPSLERDMRANAFLVETDSDGRMFFRTRTPSGAEPFLAEATTAADGQMAEVIQLLRDYRLSGDRDFLAQLWPKARLALEYAWQPGGWDADRDGVMEGEQHNTTDIAYYGPNPLMTFLYLAALKSGVAMARELDDPQTAAVYEEIAARGAPRADELLWNGEFYQQRLDLAAAAADFGASYGMGGMGDTMPGAEDSPLFMEQGQAPYNQVHNGCLSDQLFGQWLANLVGLGRLMPPEHLRTALRSIYRHNFKRMNEVPTNFLRAFAVNEEQGVVYATFPEEPGDIIPLTAVLRAHEVWSGCEYEVACLMIQEGLLAEGESIVEAIRSRHDGTARNPWNEPECGDHYARAMASYGLLQAYARLQIDLSRGRIEFSPQVNRENFATFFSVEGAWGSIKLSGNQLSIDLGSGSLAVNELVVDGRTIPLPSGITVTSGQPLDVQL